MQIYQTLRALTDARLKSGDIVETLGEFAADGWGAGRYLVKTLDEWRTTNLEDVGANWSPENNRYATRLDNGLVAKLIVDFSQDHIKVANNGYRLVGHNRYGNVATDFWSDRDVIQTRDNEFLRYHSPSTFNSVSRVSVTSDYNYDGRIFTYGPMKFEQGRFTWREPLRVGDIRVWVCNSENVHIQYKRDPVHAHDGMHINPEDRGETDIPQTASEFS